MALGLCSRWRQCIVPISPIIRRCLTTTSQIPVPNGKPPSTLDLRCQHSPCTNVVHISDKITTPADFLKAIGRSCEKKLTIEDWAEFWNTSGITIKAKGLGVRDRRYVQLIFGSSDGLLIIWTVDTYYGVWRNIAKMSRLKTLHTKLGRRRKFAGKALLYRFSEHCTYISSHVDGVPWYRLANGYDNK